MYAMGGPVYVCYGWPCICVLWVALYICAMGGPVYVCYGWPCICVLWAGLYMCAMEYTEPPIAHIYRATNITHFQGHP
jgi:hypothetical protein